MRITAMISSRSLTHHAAAAMVRRTQVAGLLVTLGAAGLWAIDVPGLGSALPTGSELTGDVSASDDGQSKPSATNRASGIDAEASFVISQNLDVAARRAPKPEQAPIASTPDPEPTPIGPEIRYLGLIEEPTRRLALISIDGQQRMLAEGRKSGDVLLTSATPDEIRVTIGREQRTILLAERTGSSVAWVASTPGGGSSSGGGVANPGAAYAAPSAITYPGVGNPGSPGTPGYSGPMPGSAGRPTGMPPNANERQARSREADARRNRTLREANPRAGGPNTNSEDADANPDVNN
jgi:hypothetical protein